ncbi:hypothetical protein XA68_13557 [Ophiocordyceps unilateralis]|uniref:Peptidase S8/S53 domain-containing protein n=1 Tax=Ophiocordyceps unilateralis TaxID=268505 RepID=A0A2A9PBF0_OPHUN|nr:hypothetical protein XA68_13557 [Ophiocordyceps unilateralis]
MRNPSSAVSHQVERKNTFSGLDESVEFSFAQCKDVLDGLEQFLRIEREPVVDDEGGDLIEVASQRSKLLDAANILSLALNVRFYKNGGTGKRQLQHLSKGFDSISNFLYETAASFCSPAEGYNDESTFTAEEMNPRNLYGPDSSTRRLICPRVSFPQQMPRGCGFKYLKLNCLCEKTEGSHDSLLEYQVSDYTFLLENPRDRSWRMCLYKPSLKHLVFLNLSAISPKDHQKIRELWETLVLQFSSAGISNDSQDLVRQTGESKEALAAEIVEITTQRGRMPMVGKPGKLLLSHYFRTAPRAQLYRSGERSEWMPSSTLSLTIVWPPPKGASTKNILLVTASKTSGIDRAPGRAESLDVMLTNVTVNQNELSLAEVNVRLRFDSIQHASAFAADFDAFKNRLLQAWAQRPFADELEVYSREYDDSARHHQQDGRLRIAVISGTSGSSKENMRMVMSRAGGYRMLCVDFEGKALKVVEQGLLQSLDMVRFWMVEEDHLGMALVQQTNWRKMVAQTAERRPRPRAPDLGGTQVIRSQEATSDEWEDQIESVKQALKAPASVKGNYKRVKVCVIDTGFSPTDKNKSRIVSYKDFAEPSRPDMCDKTLHGTFSANLILSIYDECELYVARVFQTDDTDEKREPELMAQAIEWATASPQDVDIISISAGFRHHSARLESAVQKASCANKVVFAAAANWGNTGPVAYPARHVLHTIGIFATDTMAKAADFNPEGRESAENFALLGQGFADLKDAHKRLSGTSMATAAAAAIAAVVVDFSRHADNQSIVRVADVGRMPGIIAVFLALSRPSGKFKCVSLPNLLPSNFASTAASGPGAMRQYARDTISRAMGSAN